MKLIKGKSFNMSTEHGSVRSIFFQISDILLLTFNCLDSLFSDIFVNVCHTKLFSDLSHFISFFPRWTVLLVILAKPAMNEIFLVLVSYVIIVTFIIIEICTFFATNNRYIEHLINKILENGYDHWEKFLEIVCMSKADSNDWIVLICKFSAIHFSFPFWNFQQLR